jgi:hypothetical protein
MGVDRDVVLGGDLSHMQVVAHHVLAGEPLLLTVLVEDRAAVADVARLDLRDADTLVELHGVFQLGLVVDHRPGRLVVADQLDALLLAVGGDRLPYLAAKSM